MMSETIQGVYIGGGLALLGVIGSSIVALRVAKAQLMSANAVRSQDMRKSAYADFLKVTSTVQRKTAEARLPDAPDVTIAGNAVAEATEALQVVVLVGTTEAVMAASRLAETLSRVLQRPYYDEALSTAYEHARAEFVRVARREAGGPPREHTGEPLPPDAWI